MGIPTPAELALQAEVRQLRERVTALEKDRQAAQEEHQRMVAAIQAEKDRLAAVITSISDEVLFADVQKRFVLVNPVAASEFRLEGTSRPEVEQLAASLEVFRPDGSPRPVGEAPPL